jgi:hypothetical protein
MIAAACKHVESSAERACSVQLPCIYHRLQIDVPASLPAFIACEQQAPAHCKHVVRAESQPIIFINIH